MPLTSSHRETIQAAMYRMVISARPPLEVVARSRQVNDQGENIRDIIAREMEKARFEINFNNIDFVSNEQLRTVLSQTSATPAEVDDPVLINEEARLRSLKATFLLVAAISLLAIFPAAGLPK